MFVVKREKERLLGVIAAWVRGVGGPYGRCCWVCMGAGGVPQGFAIGAQTKELDAATCIGLGGVFFVVVAVLVCFVSQKRSPCFWLSCSISSSMRGLLW